MADDTNNIRTPPGIRDCHQHPRHNPAWSELAAIRKVGVHRQLGLLLLDRHHVLGANTTSGAGALSLSLAMNEVLGSPLSKIESAQIAHISEIACGTGLGTVASLFVGGMTLRSLPGAPGRGNVQRVDTPRSLRVLSFSFGPLYTKDVLSAKSLINRIDRCGQGLLKEFELDRSADSFIALSRKFSNCMNLGTARLSKAMKRLDSRGIKSSMMMLGESFFLLIRDTELHRLSRVLREMRLKVLVSRIAGSGARLI